MEAAYLVSTIRHEAGLSLRALAEAANLATSTVHRIERGLLQPTLETINRIAEAAGMRLHLDARTDYASSMVGLARSIHTALAEGDDARPVRMAAEFAARFSTADRERQHRMLAAQPPSTGDSRWDAFLAALTEWVALRSGVDAPAWTHQPDRYLERGWWVTPMTSMRAWEYAGTPAPFQQRGIYLHRESLANV